MLGQCFYISWLTEVIILNLWAEGRQKKKKNRNYFLARLLILIKKGGLLQLKFGGVGVGVNIYLWAR